MLTLKRFAELADSYGADLDRWPDDVRRDAEALAKESAEARAILDDARSVDEAIAYVRSHDDAVFWPAGESEAALARLRAGVAGRIAASPRRKALRWFAVMTPASDLPFRWLGFATSGAVAVVAGLLLGTMYTAAPASDDVLALLLQPAPIQILAD